MHACSVYFDLEYFHINFSHAKKTLKINTSTLHLAIILAMNITAMHMLIFSVFIIMFISN